MFLLASICLSVPMMNAENQPMIVQDAPSEPTTLHAVATGLGTGLVTGTLSGALGGLFHNGWLDLLILWPCAYYGRDQLIQVDFECDPSLPTLTARQVKNKKAYHAAKNVGHLTAWLSYLITYHAIASLPKL